MDREQFDALARLFAAMPSRRAALGALLGAGMASVVGGTDAKKHRGKGKARKQGKHRGRVTAQAACASPGPSANLNGCDFDGEDFSGQDLSGSNMVGTTFRDAELVGTDLSSSNLRNATFRDANLCEADLHSSTLRNADFTNANLTRADLRSSSGCGSATFTGGTTLCQTSMCNGSVRNDDCPGADPEDVCCSAADCTASHLCVQGVCQPCTVCPVGCAFGTLEAAVAGTPAGGVIRICPGAYPARDVVIAKDLTVVGAGPGADPTTDTILESNRFQNGLLVEAGAVTLRDLRITKGHSDLNGGGIVNSANLTLRNVTVIDNTADDNGGGIENLGTLTLEAGTLVTENRASFQGGGIYQESGATIMQAGSRVTGNQTGTGHLLEKGGGIFVESGTVTVADATIVTGNTPDNCRPEGAVPNCID